MYFFGFFQTDLLINFFIPLKWAEAITWENFVPAKRDPVSPKDGFRLAGMNPRQFQATLTLETGLSDFHKMALAAFQSESPHQKPKMISYRNYKHFDKNNFEKEIKNTLTIQKISLKDFSAFKNIFLENFP